MKRYRIETRTSDTYARTDYIVADEWDFRPDDNSYCFRRDGEIVLIVAREHTVRIELYD